MFMPTEPRNAVAAVGAVAGRSDDNESRRAAEISGIWLGGRDSNPDSLVQSQLSYH
jgi:hypothetical protein